MPKTIKAIYEDGVFKPIEKVDFPEHKKITIILPEETEKTYRKKCSLKGIIDIASDCTESNLSVNHDKYLYGEAVV